MASVTAQHIPASAKPLPAGAVRRAAGVTFRPYRLDGRSILYADDMPIGVRRYQTYFVGEYYHANGKRERIGRNYVSEQSAMEKTVAYVRDRRS